MLQVNEKLNAGRLKWTNDDIFTNANDYQVTKQYL